MGYLVLFVEFFKIGLFSIGGGLATLPFLYNLADKYTWFDRSMLADMIAISESTPGPIGINMSTYAGFHAFGILGSIIATGALVLPSLIIIIIIANFLNKFSENKFVKSAFYGLRPVVTGLIAAACFEVYKISILTLDKFIQTKSITDIINPLSVVLFAIILILVIKFKKHPIVYICIGALFGILLN